MTASEESSSELSPAQLNALFDILTHHQTYQEIQSFKQPETIYSYGFPFAQRLASNEDGSDVAGDQTKCPIYADKSDTPTLQMMLTKTVLSLPPAKALPDDFWHVRIQELMALLGKAELSESYDQGAMGTRKILATASSSLLESVSRGMLGGYPSGGGDSSAAHTIVPDRTYDTTNAVEFSQAWDDVVRAMIYGTLLDDLFLFCAEHEDIEQHSSAVRTAVDYIIIQLAEFLHYVFVLSPNGRYLVKLAENTQRMVPYALIRQTLRVGNAATMINAMMKLLLAKISVGGLTNWMGLTSSAGEGMNLLQRIIAMVLSYDSSDFRKAAEKIERDKDGPGAAHLEAIREHLARPQQYHEAIRNKSVEQSQSIVIAILESVDPSLVGSINDKQHAQCAQYYASLLSIRDRNQITEVFCHQSPDLFTQVLRDGISACDPILRRIHDKIDLKEHLGDLEGFLDELIEVCKGQKKAVTPFRFASDTVGNGASLPTVKDYTDLLRRNRHLLYKWLHRVAKDTPDIRETFRDWAVSAVTVFRNPNVTVNASRQETSEQHKNKPESSRRPWPDGGSGAMNGSLQGLFSALPAETQASIAPLIDAHAAYIDALDEIAIKRRQRLIDMINGNGSNEDKNSIEGDGKAASPSRFLARWQALLDDTLIGPATPTGPVRRGRDVANITAPAITGSTWVGKGGNSQGLESEATRREAGVRDFGAAV
ncbi:px domain containing protein [Grosmannia clavigera kw1407]|uniref:Px domain containing protein n=1 Tax=Grosmannia clavigera (strain kw1407 / UAMH 11150) TaxID=655863 RepID=F0X853_GROCL|nr:px domain containing protein [Grosmannia clavigera kw1407]EFX06002.1 px domain containing protein [Grosmannia clavigera kw1407]